MATEGYCVKCKAKVEMKNMKAMQVETDIACKKCGTNMVIRWGRHGEFLACSKYPDCKTTKAIPTGVKCPRCTGEIVQKRFEEASA